MSDIVKNKRGSLAELPVSLLPGEFYVVVEGADIGRVFCGTDSGNIEVGGDLSSHEVLVASTVELGHIQVDGTSIVMDNGVASVGSDVAAFETGTWLPKITFGGLDTGIVYVIQEGWYTKIGNLVTFSVELQITSKGTDVGDMYIEDLPFLRDSAQPLSKLSAPYFRDTDLANMLDVLYDVTSSGLRLWENTGSTIDAMDDTKVGDNMRIAFTGQYFA